MVSSSNIQHVQFLCIIIEGCGDGDENTLSNITNTVL